jgi:FkbM family methyltransferase
MMRVCLDDHLQRLMYMDILHHDWIQLLPALLAPGGVFVDVGANVGYFSLLAGGLVGTTGSVIAIEPVPRTCATLTENVKLNGFSQVLMENLALGSTSGRLELHVPPSSIHRDYLVSSLPVPGWETVSVPCVTLDALSQGWARERIDLMKIDVEGHEPAVLRGGRTLLASGRVRALVMELSGVHLAQSGLTPQAMISELEGLGFLTAQLNGERRLVPRACPDVLDACDDNLVFIHRSALPAGSGHATP